MVAINWEMFYWFIYIDQNSFFNSDALDEKLMYQTLKDIKEGKTVQIPMYDYKTHSRLVFFCLLEL